MPQPASEHRRHVFISYSRADRAWVDRLRTTMAPLLREAGEELVLWDDSQIRPGERWQQMIETALARARVALLLVSAEFLASDFVMGREVPVLLEAAEREGVPILWVSLSPCWVSRTPIHAYQAVLPPEPSLEEMSEPQQRRALVCIAEEVHRALVEVTERERRREEEASLARRLREEERQRVEREARQPERERERQRVEAERLRQEEERRQAEEERLRAERQERQAAEALERQRVEVERRQAEKESRERRLREEEETLARLQREERELEARAAAERQRPQQRKAEEAARARQQLQAVMGRLLPRRRLLLAAAGVPLAAIGLARLASRPPGSGGPATAFRAPTGGSSRDQPVAAGSLPEGQGRIQTLEATHGWLERQGQGWRIQTRPLQVRSRLEQLAPEVPLRLIQIPAGRFRMGSPPEELERSDNEGPQREVRLDGFWLVQTPITQAQWREVAGWPKVERELAKDPSYSKGDDRPVEQVSWHDAREFCRRLSQRLGRTFSLPSEAQWEYACRAGTTTPFAFGDTISTELANYDGTVAYANGPKGVKRGKTTPAGSFPANAWGLQDMHGNVWEWCLDHWHDSYNGAPSDGSDWLSNAGEDAGRLLRGGSWGLNPGLCRSACRDHGAPGSADLFVGFRVVCLPQGPSLNS